MTLPSNGGLHSSRSLFTVSSLAGYLLMLLLLYLFLMINCHIKIQEQIMCYFKILIRQNQVAGAGDFNNFSFIQLKVL